MADKIYGRTRGGETRYYGDFRAYADVGGGREALVPPGGSRATTDPTVAAVVYGDRVKQLEEARRLVSLGLKPRGDEKTLADYAAEHLVRKARSGKVTDRWLCDVERHLRAAVAFFGGDTPLAYFDGRAPDDLFDPWVEHLRAQDNGRGGTLSEGNVRKYLNSVGNLFKAAVSGGHMRGNPVHAYASKPTEPQSDARYLDAREAALFLEALRTHQPNVVRGAYPWLYPLVATLLLTGGRSEEVRGLRVDDISLALGKVYIRPNGYRRRADDLKSKKARRTVPLWPQLAEILRAYLAERERSGGIGDLLFPSNRSTGGEAILTDIPSLDGICQRAGVERITPHALRHTYIAARVQTLDRGAPVALYTVAREVGHASVKMIEQVYGHLHDRAIAGGSEVVAFRVEPKHRDTTADTTAPTPLNEGDHART